MDKYNVIDLTTDLDSLNNDMYNWTLLPMDMKRLSNDECIKQHGCTVTDLYNRLKAAIVANQSKYEDDPNNLVKEATSYGWLDDPEYDHKLEVSRDLQESPYIVIIDPNITDRQELINRWNSFNSLNSRLRDLSNDYSWQLWGYNVYNMYTIVLSKLDNSEVTSGPSNIIDPNSSSVAEAMCTTEDFNRNYIIYENTAKILRHNILESNNSVDSLVIPKIVPWLTANEMHNLGIECKIDSTKDYYRQLKEAMNSGIEEDILSLGWIPSVPLNEVTIKVANDRQVKDIEKLNCYDISQLSIPDDINKGIDGYMSKPLYFVFAYKDNKNTNVALSFTSRFSTLYEFENSDKEFMGFKKVYVSDYDFKEKYKNIEVIAVFVDSECYDKIYNNCNSYETFKNMNFTSVYSILVKARNSYDPDIMRVIYSKYIDLLLRLASLEDDLAIHHGVYDLSYNKKIYKVYSGELEFYNAGEVNCLIDTITDEENLKKVQNEYCIESGLDYLIPTITIYDKQYIEEGVKETIVQYINKVIGGVQKAWDAFKGKIEGRWTKYLREINDDINKAGDDVNFTVNHFKTYNYTAMGNIKVLPFDYERMKDSLGSVNDYVSANYPNLNINKYNGNFKFALEDAMGVQQKDIKVDKAKLMDLYQFCTRDYGNYKSDIEKDIESLNNSSNNISTMVQTILDAETNATTAQESYFVYESMIFEAEGDENDPHGDNMKISDATTGETSDDNSKEKKQKSNQVTKAVNVYMTSSTKLMSAKMAILNKAYANAIMILKHYVDSTKKNPTAVKPAENADKVNNVKP